MRQKLFLVSPMLHQGGFERVCVVTARLLQPYFDVTIIIFDDADIAFSLEGLQVLNLNVPSLEGKFRKIINVGKRVLKIRKIKKQYKPDVTYSFGPTGNLVNVFSREKDRIWIGIRGYSDLNQTKLLEYFCKHSDRVVCCSKVIEADIIKAYGVKHSCVLYNPYDETELLIHSKTGEASFACQDTEQIIVSMGRDDYYKGFWHLIKAFWLVQQEQPNVKLVIIGAGEYKHEKKLALDLGLQEKIIFTGLCTNPFVNLNLGHLYVSSSISEGFPNAMVEAMMLGKPMIAVDCKSGPREILTDGAELNLPILTPQYEKYGVLVPMLSKEKNYDAGHIDESEKMLAGTIVEMLTNSALMEEYSKRSVARAKDFSYEAYRLQLRNMMQSDQ